MLAPLQWLLCRLVSEPPLHLPRLFHRLFCRLLGMDVVLSGAPVAQGPVLFVANHLSWIDIPVLGSRLPGAFVAKSEIAGWGPVGPLAALARTIFIERSRRTTAGHQRNAIAERLMQGQGVILFPEGATSAGVHVQPFKSALFAALDGEGSGDWLVQPVSLAYTRLSGLPVTRKQLPHIAWVGDVGLKEHALELLRLGRLRAEVLLHPPVRRSDFASRKALAQHAEAAVRNGYVALMRGRLG